jgi:hypothetical protein
VGCDVNTSRVWFLLKSNFGNNRINAFDSMSGEFIGHLENAEHNPIELDGLWELAFGNGYQKQPLYNLYFTAGLNADVRRSVVEACLLKWRNQH